MVTAKRRKVTTTSEKLVGETRAVITVSRDDKSTKRIRSSCIVDTGSDWTVLPADVLRGLGIKPHRREEFALANGSRVERNIGRAFVRYRGVGEFTPVVFGEDGDARLLGVVTLELLGLGVDPLRRELFPLDLRL